MINIMNKSRKNDRELSQRVDVIPCVVMESRRNCSFFLSSASLILTFKIIEKIRGGNDSRVAWSRSRSHERRVQNYGKGFHDTCMMIKKMVRRKKGRQTQQTEVIRSILT
jgi:hypothetical protein